MTWNQMVVACRWWLVSLAVAFAVAGQSPAVLVRFDLRQPEEVSRLQGLPLKVCLRTDNFVLATVAVTELPHLQRSGIAHEIVDYEAWSQPYYLLTRHDEHASPPAGAGARVIAANAAEIVVKMSEAEVLRAAQHGWHPVRLSERPLPLVAAGPQFHPQWRAAGTDTMLPRLIAQISDSTIGTYLQRLEAFRSRYSFSDSIVPARAWLFRKFQEFGYTDVRFDPFPWFNTTQMNVVATKPGTHKTPRLLIVGGHYDSVVYDGGNAAVYAPGTDDNASGTTATLEIARVLAREELETTILFIAFGAEEQGLGGSRHFAENARRQGMSIDLVLNMDMIANVADAHPDVNILTDRPSQAFALLVEHLTRQYSTLLPVIAASSGNSDHYPFQQAGYHALFLHEGDFSPNWHRSTDVMANISIPYAKEVIKVVLAALVQVANSPATPVGFQAAEVGDGQSQILRWQANQEPDLAGYKLFLGSASGSYNEMRMVATPFDTLRGLTENQRMYAAVAAIDQSGNESLLTPELAFTPRRTPVAPAALDATSQAATITLTWQANNTELDLAGYNIYRSLAPQQGFALATFVPAPQTTWQDANVAPHTFYYYQVKAVDRTALESAASNLVKGRLATHDRGILIVDNTRDGDGSALRPTDAEVDDFYRALLAGYNVTSEWDLADSTAQQITLSDADLGVYSTVIWHAEARQARPMASDTVALRKYLEQGGKLWLTGWSLLRALGTSPGNEVIYPNGSFVRDYLKIRAARVAADRDFKAAESRRAGYPSLEVDSLRAALFNGNLLEIDAFLPPLAEEPQTETIYSYVSATGIAAVNHGRPVGLRFLGNRYRLVVFDFPLYFMEAGAAAQAARQALADLGETATGVAEGSPSHGSLPRQFALQQNYPNPFNPATTIRYQLPLASHVVLAIFNTAGQEVARLVDGVQPAGTHAVSWQGITPEGKPVASGIYFCKMSTAGFTQVRKMVLVR
ncbi:MAG: M20/M25/M40 family metallo-hydrolase [candidate division KSB1 bacterium]|nr:M20/M25/M40 family metallo-hydrolase [candidate division KSB1 bacterium]MDZ7276382.1 M20/M25/M40 family metallo-hydrolase [candidate division KSB1 bacterium]MDZ7287666.1 M20/M25/M40 family metallo-hydrolase [candidate division KSB1 bacterium]MDZ7299994.1 M20/M25/M40 family metallo-hydrolase [candidate division KSB1 bacterium]MDZ7307337.1 M20/M25/M40 family metallo-hydrolase [candidate division KSB1 bacterium]